MKKRRRLFNLANSLTLTRFALAPVMLLLIQNMENPAYNSDAWKVSLTILVVLAVALLTDLFDGMAARARKEVTNFGKIMDPVADSTFFMTMLFGLSDCARFGEYVSVWFPILVLYREIAMHILRRYAALKGHAAPAKMSGKIKTFSQSVVTSLFFLLVLVRDWMEAFSPGGSPISENFLGHFVFYLSCFIVALTYWSLIEYSKDVPELIAEYAQPDEAVAPTEPKGNE